MAGLRKYRLLRYMHSRSVLVMEVMETGDRSIMSGHPNSEGNFGYGVE